MNEHVRMSGRKVERRDEVRETPPCDRGAEIDAAAPASVVPSKILTDPLGEEALSANGTTHRVPFDNDAYRWVPRTDDDAP